MKKLILVIIAVGALGLPAIAADKVQMLATKLEPAEQGVFDSWIPKMFSGPTEIITGLSDDTPNMFCQFRTDESRWAFTCHLSDGTILIVQRGDYVNRQVLDIQPVAPFHPLTPQGKENR